jgi:hypothetical protein
MEQRKELEDSILAGIIATFKNIKVNPKRDFSGRVVFLVSGDVDEAIEAVYANRPVGALDVLRSIKGMRQAIFSLKGNGQGAGYGRTRVE